MAPVSLGTEGITTEDRVFHGSRFEEVEEALFSFPYQSPWGAPGQPVMPIHKVSLASVLRGALPFSQNYVFRKAAERAVDSAADLRWGPDRKGFRRLLHPNGICLSGEWEITEATSYSGYFSTGSKGLIIGRYSTCCSETRRGASRSLSLVGKLYPTTDPKHREPLRPAHFITQQDLGGAYNEYINEVELRNAPDTRAWRRGSGIGILLTTGAVFKRVDKKPTVRQLYQIAELGNTDSEPTRTPTFMRLLVAPKQPKIEGESLDFRDEVMAQIYDRGEAIPKRTLTFHIEVTDEGETHGPPFFERRTFRGWRYIGKITFHKAAASYNGDFVIHFNHPTWREDQNDPSTATRIQGRKVR
jgi:hypothetical protein